MHATLPLLQVTEFPPLTRHQLTTLQVNLGYRCNQSCLHCHVNAGPNRTEMMDGETLSLIPFCARRTGNYYARSGSVEHSFPFKGKVGMGKGVEQKAHPVCLLARHCRGTARVLSRGVMVSVIRSGRTMKLTLNYRSNPWILAS